MTTFRELTTVIHADRIILNHMNKSGTTYICNAFLADEFTRLLADYGDIEVGRVNFRTSYGNWPEIFLVPTKLGE